MHLKNNLLSLQSCGESVEKALSIHYMSLQVNGMFYSNYRTMIFYGHNLPKKNRELNVHGTVGFYAQYLSDLEYVPECSRQYLIGKASEILERLVLKGHVSERNMSKLINSKPLYWEYIRQIPFEYLYPEYYMTLKEKSSKLLNIHLLDSLYVEDNWFKTVLCIHSGFTRYCIYALEGNGIVGKYDIPSDLKKYYHLLKCLSSKAVLSGNSAFLLDSIRHRIDKWTIVGYRPHRRSIRPNREYALRDILNTHTSVIEPSNRIMSEQFDLVPSFIGDEAKTNIVYAKTFRTYLEENRFYLNL